MTQRQAILKRLQRGETLTPFEALHDPEIGSMRLSERIRELMRDGHDIERGRVKVESGKIVAAYKLRPKDSLF